MKIHVSHLTRYDYGRAVRLLPHLLYPRPREGPLLQMQHFSFKFSPEATLNWIRDDYDNILACAQILQEAAVLEIHSDFEVTTHDSNPLNFMVKDYARVFPFAYEPLHRFNLAIYLAPPSPETQAGVRRWLDQHFQNRPKEIVPYLFALNETIKRTLRGRRREEHGIQPSLETLRLGSGSCRDFAVLLIEMARTLGLAARFVSGYYYDPAIDTSVSGSMHAWAEIYIPGAGWKGLDPTCGVFCNDAFVPVAHAAVAESVNPIQGSYVSAIASKVRPTTQILIERRG